MKIKLNIVDITRSLAFKHMIGTLSLITTAAIMLKLIIIPMSVEQMPQLTMVVFSLTLLFAYVQSEMIFEVSDRYSGNTPKHYFVLPVFGMIIIILFEQALVKLSGDVASHWSFSVQYLLIMYLHVAKSMVRIKNLRNA